MPAISRRRQHSRRAGQLAAAARARRKAQNQDQDSLSLQPPQATDTESTLQVPKAESKEDSASEKRSEKDVPTGEHDSHNAGGNQTLPMLSARRKPDIHRIATNDLRERLSAFLPAMKAANEELEAKEDKKDLRIEIDDSDSNEGDEESQRYIEMNLGLGVLKQQEDDETSSSGSDDSSSEESDDDKTSPAKRKKDVMHRLMGTSLEDAKKPKIEEV